MQIRSQMWKLIDMNNKFGSLNAVVHITSHKWAKRMSAIEQISNSVLMSIKSSSLFISIKFSSLFICQSNLVLCSYVNQIWFFVLFLLITRTCIRRRARPRDYFFLNVLFASANKNKYSQQNHKWTCGCCLLILNYFLPLVSKNSRSLSSLDLYVFYFNLFHSICAGAHANNTQKQNKNVLK